MGLGKRLFITGLLAVLILCLAACGGNVSAAGPSGTNPQILALSPDTARVASTFTLQVQGQNFSPDNQVIFNGTPKATTYVSPTLLLAKISSTDLSQPTTATVYVNDPKSSTKSNASHVKVIAPLAITSTSLANAVLGSGYSSSLAATGGKRPYTWGAGTALPPGLTLASSGAISGTPTQAGNYSFVATLQDNSNPSLTTSATVSLNVTSGITTLSATSQTLPGATAGKPYSAALTQSGGKSPYSWSATSSLPAGLTLNSAGTVSGTPTAAGNFSFTAAVNDSSSPTQSSSGTYKVTVATAAAPLIIATSSLPSGTSGTSYSTSLSASGGTIPYTWSATTSLPAGLTLNSNGVLSGTPTMSGTSSFGVKVTDTASPTQTATATLSLSVSAAPAAPLAISTTSVPSATSGQSYSVTLIATGGTTPYKWSATGLPGGLTMSSGGLISGTPSSSGTFSFTSKVTDSSSTTQSASKTLALTVNAAASTNPLSITTSTLPGGTVGSNYSATVQATGGTGAYTWNVASGALPSGVTLSATTGQLSGTPGTAAQYNFTLRVSDSASPANTSSKSYSVTIASASQSSSGSSTLFPSVITYASLSQIAVPVTDADYNYYLSKIDTGHGSDTVPGMVQRSSTFTPVKYEVIQAIGSGYTPFDNSPDVVAAISYFTSHGYDPETLWLHYADDSTVTDRCGQTWTVKGWGQGSATSKAQARVRSCGGYIYNHQDAHVREWLNYHYVQDISEIEPVSGRRLYRQIFIDSMGPLNLTGSSGAVEIPQTVSGGHIIEYSSQTMEAITTSGTYSNAVVGALAGMKTAMHAAFPDAVLRENLANFIDSNSYTQATTVDGDLTEWFDYEDPGMGAGIAPKYDFVKSLTDAGKSFVWSEGLDANTVPNLNNYNGCNYPSALSRHRMYGLTDYWIAKQGNLVLFEERPINELLSSFWYAAQERNVGQPSTAQYTTWSTGVDLAGQNYRIYRRDYTSGAIMLNRTRYGWASSDNNDYGTKTPMLNLGGTYHVLYSDGTTGPAITQIGLCLGEAVTLVP